MSNNEYNELVIQTAFRVTKALAAFKNEPPNVQQRARQAIMWRVSRMMGEVDSSLIIENLEVQPHPAR